MPIVRIHLCNNHFCLRHYFFLVPSNAVSLGCLKEMGRVHQYIIPETFDSWRLCRDECHNRRMKV